MPDNDRIEIDGSLGAREATVAYWNNGRKLAVLTSDRDSLAAEFELEQKIATGR
jgi:hypothetical protein